MSYSLRDKLTLINKYRAITPLSCPNGTDHVDMIPKLIVKFPEDEVSLSCLTCGFQSVPGSKFYNDVTDYLMSIDIDSV